MTKILMAYAAEGRLDGAGVSAPIVDVPKKELFVYCEKNGNSSFLDFLKQIKGTPGLRITAVLECTEDGLIGSLTDDKLCDNIARACSFDEKCGGISVYPSFGRSALCEAALGMDREFASRSIRQDFECGRKSIILSDGMDPFTGKEPSAYREMILGYIRSLIQMNVQFCRNAETAGKLLAGEGLLVPNMKASSAASVGTAGSASENGSTKASAPKSEKTAKAQTLPKAPTPEQVLEASKKRYVLQTDCNLLKQSDFMNFPIGSTVYSPERKILTPLAKDALHNRQLRFINGRQATYTY